MVTNLFPTGFSSSNSLTAASLRTIENVSLDKSSEKNLPSFIFNSYASIKLFSTAIILGAYALFAPSPSTAIGKPLRLRAGRELDVVTSLIKGFASNSFLNDS